MQEFLYFVVDLFYNTKYTPLRSNDYVIRYGSNFEGNKNEWSIEADEECKIICIS